MALTADEMTLVKNLKKVDDLKREIKTINQVAFDAANIKHVEIDVIETQRVADVKVKQDLIDAINIEIGK